MTTQRCVEPGCRRTVPYIGHARCDDHRIKWVPEWIRRARENTLVVKDYSRAA